MIILLFITMAALACSPAATAPPSVTTPSPSTTPANSSGSQYTSITPNIVSFEVSPDKIQAGSDITLSWEVTNADLVSIDQGIGNVPLKGTRTLIPKSTSSYILTATNSSGSTTAKVHITVSGTIPESTPASFNLPQVATFSVEPSNIEINSEQPVTLTWDVRNAYDVMIEPGFRIIPVKGTAMITPGFTTTYKLTATNDQGTILAATTVTVSGIPTSEETPVIEYFKVDRYVIKKGETAVLNWKTTEASSVTIDKDVGIVSGEGTTRVSPAETTIYTMTAINPRGAQFQTVVVNVK